MQRSVVIESLSSLPPAGHRLLCECHGVLYKQLSAWMLHGLLLADKHEFFIEQRQKKEQVRGTQCVMHAALSVLIILHGTTLMLLLLLLLLLTVLIVALARVAGGRVGI